AASARFPETRADGTPCRTALPAGAGLSAAGPVTAAASGAGCGEPVASNGSACGDNASDGCALSPDLPSAALSGTLRDGSGRSLPYSVRVAACGCPATPDRPAAGFAASCLFPVIVLG